jgi:hypothetical protein
MRHALLIVAILGVSAAAVLGAEGDRPPRRRDREAAAPPAAPAGPSIGELTGQAASLEQAIRQTSDATARKRLTEELEKVRQQMGPYDAAGKRNRCQAMWHDSAIEALETDCKRYTGRPGGGPLGTQARLHIRRMAAACLTLGWRMPDSAVRYQVDAYGAYLVNNMAILDSLSDTLTTAAAREATLGDAGKAAVAKVRAAVTRMGELSDALTEAKPETGDALLTPLAEFTQALIQAREGELAVRTSVGSAPAEGAAPATATPPEAEPPPMTDAEKAALQKVRDTVAARKDGPWAPLAEDLGRLAGAVEAGFALPSARPKARELLEKIGLASRLIDSLAAGTAAPADYVAEVQAELAAAFRQIGVAISRARGYARLDAAWQDDALRRQIEAAGLTPAAAKGLLYAAYQMRPPSPRGGVGVDATPAAEDVQSQRPARPLCQSVADALERAAPGPPKDMSPRIRECYTRVAENFRASVEIAGAAFPDTLAAGLARLQAAADRGGDLSRLARADRVLASIQKHRPQKAGAIGGQVLRAAQELAMESAAPMPARRTLDGIIGPFESLDTFPLPDETHRRAVAALLGRVYPTAAGVLTQDLAAGIDAAAEGNPLPLRQATAPRYLFALLTRRCAAETDNLGRVTTDNLHAFSLSGKVWTPMVEKLDGRLRALFTEYARSGRRSLDLGEPVRWDAIYSPVVTAQRETLTERSESETDLTFLLANLERVAVPSPRLATVMGWVFGYHGTEAAAALNAGMDSVADWHRDFLRGRVGLLRPPEPVAAP